MYRVVRDRHVPVGMGFSLKPPKWLKKVVGTIVGGANQAQQAVNAVNANYPSTSVAPPQFYERPVPSWVIPAAIGVGVLLMMRPGRR